MTTTTTTTRMTLTEAAEKARDQAGGLGIVYVTHTKARGYQVERFDVNCRQAVQAWSNHRRWDEAAKHDHDLETEAPKGTIR